MKVIVFGATGFVGNHLCRELLKAEHQVVVASRTERELEADLTSQGAELAVVDMADAVTLVKAMRDCDAVCNCVGVNREKKDQNFEKVHVTFVRNIVSAMRQTGVNRLLQVSFLRARSKCDSPYHVTKWQAEEHIRNSGLDYTIFKPGVIYGEGDGFLTNLKTTLTSFPFFGLVGFSHPKIAPVAIRDLCFAMRHSLEREECLNKTFAVVGPEEFTLSEVVDQVASTVQTVPSKIPLPVFVHRIAAMGMEFFMKEPLLTNAQVTMLSESLAEGTPECEELPLELRPRTKFLK